MITKSGTNQFKGSAFEFYNSDSLNATPKYFGAGAVPKKLPVKPNTYGGTFGGPIKKNKVFFFGSFEGFRRDAEPVHVLQRARRERCARATSAALEHEWLAPADLRSDHGNANGIDRTQFANNQIPSGMIEPDRAEGA